MVISQLYLHDLVDPCALFTCNKLHPEPVLGTGLELARAPFLVQSTEAWRRRLLSKRYEHGLLDWELEETALEADVPDQLLKSPMPGISALVCTAAEVTARQQLLANTGAVNIMPDDQGCAQKAAAEEIEDAALRVSQSAEGGPHSAGDVEALPEPLDQPASLPENKATGGEHCGTGKDIEVQVCNRHV